MATGAYDLDFSDEIDKDLKCAVCFYVCKEPHQLTCCGKLLCQSCLKEWKQHSTKCPHCRLDMQHFPDVKSKRSIMHLRVKCSQYSDDPGCKEWIWWVTSSRRNVAIWRCHVPMAVKFFSYRGKMWKHVWQIVRNEITNAPCAKRKANTWQLHPIITRASVPRYN